MIEEIPEFTFVHCTSLREVSLPATLHAIRVKAFVNCAAPEVAALTLHHSCPLVDRGVSESLLSIPAVYCETCRFQAARIFELSIKQGKVEYGGGHMPSLMLLTNASTPTSPSGFESYRLMQTIFGEKTSRSCTKGQQCFRGRKEASAT